MCNVGNNGIVNTVIGALLGFWGAKTIFYIKRRSNAIDEFILAFLDTKMMIEESIPHPIIPSDDDKKPPCTILGEGGNICKVLFEERVKHKTAIVRLSFYVSKKKFSKITKAYDHYYNPCGIRGSLKLIYETSFCIYNMDENSIEKIIHRKVSGKDLALENIENVLKAASN